MKYLLGIDIGTSSAKVVVIDSSGQMLAWAGREYPIRAPQPGWAEQDPADWLAAAVQCASQALRESQIDPNHVAGIGLTGQMHSMVAVDVHGEPLRPAIIWADQRSGPQVKYLTSQIGPTRLAEWTGNPLASGFMLASWAWLREYEPHLAAQTRLLMLPKDWVRLCLTGLAGAEPSDASSTLLFDPHVRDWSQPVLNQVGLSRDQLPPISPSAAVAGALLPEIASICGLKAGLPVVYGCSDVTAQALAQGVVHPGQVSVTIGTGGQLFAPVSEPRHDPQLRVHLFCHALPGIWHHEAAVLSAGLALRWLRDQVWPSSNYQQLADAAAQVEAGLDGLFFLPFLAGERTPYMHPGLRAAFAGLGLRHAQPHLIRAVMEGVVFALRQALDLMENLAGPSGVQQRNRGMLVASGGAAAHPLWLQLQADIFNRPLLVYNSPQATARGAALLAGMGLGLYVDQMPYEQSEPDNHITGEKSVLYPDPSRAHRYESAFKDWMIWANQVAHHYQDEKVK